MPAERGDGRRATRSPRSSFSTVGTSRFPSIDRGADALGRPLGEYESGTFPGEASAIQTQHTLTYNALTGQVISDINSATVNSSTAPEGTDPARYVYAPDGNMVLREMCVFGSTTPSQYIYALTDSTGTVVAIAGATGSVDERYVFDGLGNGQALQPSGAAYDPTTFTNPNRSANWQFQQQFSGSVFDPSTQLLQSAGTDYAWNIVYQGNIYNGIPGVYQTANGAFNPREQGLLAPDLSVIQAGVSIYNPTAGETGFNGWYDRNAGAIAGLSETGLALAGTYLTAGLAAPLLSSALGALGAATAGAAADTGTAVVEAASTVDEAASAVSTAVNVENNVKQSVVIAKATLGAISGGISGFTGSAADHGTLAEDLISGGFGAIFGGVAGGFGAGLKLSPLVQMAVGTAGATVANTASQAVEYLQFGRKFDLGQVAAAGAAGFAAPLVSGLTIVDSIIGGEAPAFEVYATGLPTAVWEGLVHTGLENPSLLSNEANTLYGGGE